MATKREVMLAGTPARLAHMLASDAPDVLAASGIGQDDAALVETNFQVVFGGTGTGVRLRPATGQWLHFLFNGNGYEIRVYADGDEYINDIPPGQPFLLEAFMTGVFAPARQQWIAGALAGSGSQVAGGGIPDAPTDGNVYGRLNAAWTPVIPAAGGMISGTGPGTLVINRNAVLPAAPAGLVSVLRVIGANGENPGLVVDGYGVGASGADALMMRVARGTGAAPSALVSGDSLGNLAWRGYGATAYSAAAAARVNASAIENWSDIAQGARINLQTNPAGSAALVTQAMIGPGLTVGAPTGPAGGMLVGDVNATRVMVNGIPVSAGGGISDAPSNGLSYGRLNAAWQPVLPTAGGTISGSLTVGAPTAPGGGMLVGDVNATRVMVNGVPVGAGGGIADAPSDGTSYSRQNAGWTNTPAVRGATINGTAPGMLTINRNAVLPAAPTGFVPAVRVIGADGEHVGLILDDFGGGGVPSSGLFMRGARGTGAAPSAALSGDSLGNIAWRGYGATGFGAAAVVRIIGAALENFTDAAQGAQLVLQTNPVGSIVAVTQAMIGPGLTVGAPTAPAGGMLLGDVNATRVMVNGIPVSAGGGLTDAPSNGISYGRLNAAWQPVLAIAGGTISGSLTVGAPTAPAGGMLTGDVNATRVMVNGVPVGAGGIADAPSDGTFYARLNATWAHIVDTLSTAAAAGTTQATATQLTSQFNVVTTVAAGAGVALIAGTAGGRCKVRNSGANPLLCYPRNGDSAAINAQAVNTAITIPPNTTTYFEAQGLTQWFTIP